MKTIALSIYLLWAACVVAFGQDRDLTGYTLVFADEFNDLSLSTHRGKGSARWGDWPPSGPEGAFSFSHWGQVEWGNSWWMVNSGILRLRMIYHPSWPDPNRKWVSGLIASMDVQKSGFAQRYGYWSARIKMPPAGEGAWGAFWLSSVSAINNNDNSGYEIDIVEWYGTPGQYGWSIHPWNQDGSQGEGEGGSWVSIPGEDAINTWHVYGAEVNRENIIIYLDGKEVGRRPTSPEYLSEFYIICNYALRNPHPDEPFASRSPSYMQVDWIRAYALPALLPPTNLRLDE